MSSQENNLNIQPIFFNFIIEENFSLPNSAELIKYSYEKVKIDKEYIEKDGQDQTLILDTKLPILKPMIDKMTDIFNQIHLRLGFNKELCQQIKDIWININNNKNIDPPHNHPGNFFSAVYYLQANENASEIRFMNPNQAHTQIISPHFVNEYNGFNSSEWFIKPKTGMAIFFPSWLYHYVKPHNDSSDRISIAFNTVINDR